MDVMTQFNESQYYSFFKVDECTYYVRRTVPSPTIQHDSPPRFDRTRVVRIEQSIDEKNYLHCSCGYYDRNRIPCRHMYAILDRNPVAMDCDLRNLKMYSAHFAKEQKFSDICNTHFMTNMRKGVTVTLPLIINEENREQDLSKFVNALHELILLNPICDVFED